MPVSYTHLDVYKRQIGYRTTILNDVIKQNRCIDKVMNTEWQQQLL